jgi:hypothetical protein
MSIPESKLNFYVIQVSSSNYNLHNINTDNKVLTLVTSDELRDFLDLNDPDHPFLFFNKEADDLSGLINDGSPLIDRLMGRIDMSKEYNSAIKDYNLTDTFYTDYMSSYSTDYNVSYTPDGYPTPIDDKQLSFTFATKNESKNQEELTDKYEETYLSNVDKIIDLAQAIPFLPDDSKASEEEE